MARRWPNASPPPAGDPPKPKLPTPIKLDRLAFHLAAAGYDTAISQYLVQGFTEGFPIGHNSQAADITAANSKGAHHCPDIVQEKLTEELNKNRIAGPFNSPPFHPFQTSPLNIREKKTPGKFRLIHDLSYPYNTTSVNNNIPAASKRVQYSTVGYAIQILLHLPQGTFMCKTDIADAYRLIPIHPADHPKLGFSFQNQFYYDKVLPMGCASSCRIFETFGTALQAIFLHYAPHAHCVHMVDDFLILADTHSDCKNFLTTFQNLCADIGIPLAPGKTPPPPSPITTFLGIELDSSSQTARLPQDKLQAYAMAVTNTMACKHLRRSELESLVGKLSFAASVVPARAFLRRLFDLVHSVKKPFHYVPTRETHQDLLTWSSFLSNYNGVTFFRSAKATTSTVLNMASDASKMGLGACFGSRWIQAPYPATWQHLHITILELYPIYLMIAIFGHKIANSTIHFLCDNSAVTEIINKQSSKNKTAMKIVRPLVLLLIQHNIDLRCQHIAGRLNILPDLISRFQVTDGVLGQHNMSHQPTPIPHHLLPGNFAIS